MTVAIIVPVLGRPDAVDKLVDSSTAADARARILFVCSPNDVEEIAAVTRAHQRNHRVLAPAVVDWEPGRGDYARKVNHGVAYLSQPEFGLDWFLMGGDDLHFHPGWIDACLAEHRATGGEVIGTNDLGNATVMRGAHSTHPLVARSYVEEQGGTADKEPGTMLYEGYWHNFCDTELVQVAQARGYWGFARDAHVEHLHPFWGKGKDDDTYKLGRVHYHDDRIAYEDRLRRLIEPLAVASR